MSEQESLVAVINPPGVTLVLRRPLLVILKRRWRTKSTTVPLCKEFNQKVLRVRATLCVEKGWGRMVETTNKLCFGVSRVGTVWKRHDSSAKYSNLRDNNSYKCSISWSNQHSTEGCVEKRWGHEGSDEKRIRFS